MGTKTTEKTPFFARYLEGQLKVKSGVRAGKKKKPEITTMKFPSDSDEGGLVKL